LQSKAVSGIVLTTLLISMLTLAFNIQPVKAEPTTWTVDDDGPADFSIIQEAINVANPGDTIYVYNGTYHEHVVVNKTLSLIGENKSSTIIDGGRAFIVVDVTANNVVVSGFTILNGGRGIRLWSSTDNIVSDNYVMINDYGIYVDESQNNTIIRNMIAGIQGIKISEYGIVLWRSPNTEVIENIILTNNKEGIRIEFSPNSKVIQNLISTSREGIRISHSSNNLISQNNIIFNRDYGIQAYQSHNNTIIQNTITNTSTLRGRDANPGIVLSDSHLNKIIQNNLTNNFNGLQLFYSMANLISRNNITNNDYIGILATHSGYNNISYNNVTSNNYVGIRLDYSFSNNNEVSGNIVAENDYGIFLASSANNNSVFGNTITSNNRGIYLSGTSNNRFFHNNLVDNTQQVVSYDSTNFWDDGYPSGGNHWSDYTDVDLHSGPNQNETGNDGIWDHSYDMDLNNKDRYPLVNPWVPRIVGVRVGDWVKYTVEITGYRPGFPVDLNDVEWGKTSVQAVSGTIIEVELVWHLKNGTEITMTGPVDVVTSGYPSPTFMSGLFIAKDLPTGATLYATYPLGPIPPSLKINETISKEYLGVSRETNHVNATKWGIHVDAYWDRATGVLIESKETFSTSWSWHVQIVDTNLWKAPIPTNIDELKTKVEELALQDEIDNRGIVRSLLAKLKVAEKLVDKGKVDEAKTILEDFIIQVQELSEIHITVEATDILIQSTEYIISQL